MKWLRSVAIIALAVLWLPITMHCQLEQFPSLAFLACCTHPDKAPHQDNDCDEDGCAVVESGLYMTANCPVEVFAPEFGPVELPAWYVTLQLPVLLRVVTVTSTGPPSPAGPWQFSTRAALLPRAPSSIA